ncbi:hypothetical protein PPYR_14807 [Photinus pyralis]|uniref:Retrotransposon gag domain-containing protein n=1 Tax=Photinus pyralis TaxID=7054 RepID=A0A5N4A6G3_PHOPY|nr:hypothetical protein PPYR_14807 [Photinus pyralis]
MERRPIEQLNLSGNVAENWKSWIQRFEIYSTATELDVKAEKTQCAQLLHCLGEESIKIYNTFQFSVEDQNKIKPLKSAFNDYFTPKKNLTYERYKFFTSRQNNLKIEEYVTQLKNLANQCEFGTEELKNELIKTMVIIGIKDSHLREKLIQNEDQTLDKVIECCVITENSKKNMQLMKITETPSPTTAGDKDSEMIDAMAYIRP